MDFRIHVENQTRARDDVSRKQLRLYQLYSRTSGKHIQVLGRRISARGEDGDKYGRYQPPLPSPSPQVQIPGLPCPGCVAWHLAQPFWPSASLSANCRCGVSPGEPWREHSLLCWGRPVVMGIGGFPGMAQSR